MANIRHFGVTAAAAFVFTACAGNALANTADIAGTAAKTAPADEHMSLLGKDAALLTRECRRHRCRGYDALADSRHPDIQGYCGRHLLRPEGWTCLGGTSVYVRGGDHWKWSFGINLPAG